MMNPKRTRLKSWILFLTILFNTATATHAATDHLLDLGIKNSVLIDSAHISVMTNEKEGLIDIGKQTLPWQWDQFYPKKSGLISIQLNWDINGQDFKKISQEGLTLAFLTKRIGHRYRYSINGSYWENRGWLEPHSTFVKNPKYHLIPSHLLINGINTLAIEMRVEPANLDGITQVEIGEQDYIYERFHSEEKTREFILLFALASSFIICSLALFTWFSSNKQGFYLIVFFAELCFSLQQLLNHVTSPPIPTWLWNSLLQTLTLYYIFLLLMLPSKLIFIKNQFLIKAYKSMLYLALPIILFIFYIDNYKLYSHFLKPIIAFIGFAGLIQYTLIAWKLKNNNIKILALSGWSIYLLFLRDYLVLDLDVFSKQFELQRYVNLFFLFFNFHLGYLIIKREHMVEQEIFKLKQITTHERRHVVSDIHDTVGIHFMELQNMIELEQSRKNIEAQISKISQYLRTPLDSHKQKMAHLAKTFSIWKNRIQPIFNSHQIQLVWNVPDLPVLPISGVDAQHLKKVANEVAANIINHSQANQVSIDVILNELNHTLEFTIADNGIGYNPQTLPSAGQGLRNIQLRCDIIGIKFEIVQNSPRGMRHIFTLPIGALTKNAHEKSDHEKAALLGSAKPDNAAI